MSKLREVANYLILAYEKQTETRFESNELKLQKLMYLCQRESLLLTDQTLFDNQFEGWKYGPVLPELRHYFEENYSPMFNFDSLTDEEKYIINNVISQYGMYEAWYLANLTHNESSWLNSRKGLDEDEEGKVKLLVDDIIEDAKKIRPYDYLFDMYIDEFDDYNEGAIND